MKLLVVFSALVSICASSAIPLVPGDNSHYVEGESRYIWMPDGEGVPHLVDLQEPVDEVALKTYTRNGANNQYWLYTRRNPNNPQVIVQGNLNTLLNSNYGSGLPLKVIVHGWNNHGNSEVNSMVKDAFLAAGDVNVIVVDWSSLAASNYISAVSGVPSVGQFIGSFLTWVIQNTNTNWNQVHLAGFSLGAHIVGNAGRAAGSLPARITGLDPAGPMWSGNSNALNANSAVYVESIHTDGGLLGIFNAISNADFYPNGGRNPQPGCGNSSCSHGRSYQYFAASIQFNHLVGRLCSNINQAQNVQCTGSSLNMGNNILNKSGNGIYGLTTGNNWPF